MIVEMNGTERNVISENVGPGSDRELLKKERKKDGRNNVRKKETAMTQNVRRKKQRM